MCSGKTEVNITEQVCSDKTWLNVSQQVCFDKIEEHL